MKRTLFIFIVVWATAMAAQTSVPTGALRGLFSIAENEQVYFSQGNLMHNTDGTWSFAARQYDAPENSLLTWGSSGYGNPDTIGVNNIRYSDFDGSIYANFDWGVYNPITNGGNRPGLWRTLTRGEWDYLLTHHTCTWTTEGGVDGVKIMADDNVNYLFLPGGYYWTCMAGTDGQYAEAFYFHEADIPYQLWANQSRSTKSYVRPVYVADSEAWITVTDRSDNTATLTPYIDNPPVNVHLIRSLYSDGWNTLCLPFDLSADEVTDAFGTDCQLYAFDGAEYKQTTNELDLRLTSAASIIAGEPYILLPQSDIINPCFYDRLIRWTSASGEQLPTGDAISFHGIINPYRLPAGDKQYLFVTATDELNWSKPTDQTSMYGLRAYFHVPDLAVPQNTVAPRATLRIDRITSLTPFSRGPGGVSDSPTSRFTNSPIPRFTKYIANGHLVIVCGDKEYNVLGI